MKRREYLIFTLILLLCTSSALIVGIKISDSKKNNSYFDDKTRRHVDTISMMLEQTSGAGDYVMTTRDSWPTEGYFFNPELSKCENGGELSWDDTNKRVLMSGNTSDKCYVYFDKPLEFYLDDVLFQAAPNMTWEEWLNSSYSDNWSYKSKIYPFSYYYDKKVNGYEGNCSDYMPMCLGKDVIDNIFMANGHALAIATSETLYTGAFLSHTHREADFCERSGANIECYTTKVNVIKKQNRLIDTLNSVNEYAKTLTNPAISSSDIADNNYYIMEFWFSCLTSDTLIDVEEIDEKGKKRRRRKKLKDIKVGDKVICINPVTLELDTDTVIECDGTMNKRHTCYDNWYFDDGTILTTVHRHRFYNVENSKFMYMEEWNIGDHGVNIENKKIKLIKHEHIEEEIKHCTLFTEKYNNYFANGLLSGNRKSKNIQL
jgi:hypothetical protein